MTSLCITMPEDMARATDEAAKSLRISKTEFIRQAIAQELNNFERKVEERKIIKSFGSMERSKSYSRESETIMNSFSLNLPNEEEGWWSK